MFHWVVGFFFIPLDNNWINFWHLLALLRSYSVYDCYEVIIHGINVKEPFILWLIM